MPRKRPSTNGERAAIYVRRSTSKTRGGGLESVSFEIQIDSAETFIREHGWEYDPKVDRVIETVSATRVRDRPGWLTLLDKADAGTYQHIVVYNLDRAARLWGDWSRIFDHTNFRLWSAKQQINSVEHAEVMQMAVVFGGREARLIALRVGDAKKKLAEGGNFLGTFAPFGFQIVQRDGRRILTPKPGEDELLKQAIDRVIAGASVAAAARWLTEQGAVPAGPKRTGPDGKKRKNRYWSSAALIRLLRSPVLIGCRSYKTASASGAEAHGREPLRNPKTHELDVVFDPLISVAKWRQLQARLARQSKSRLKDASPSLLGGLVFCSQCGYPMGASGGNTERRHTMVYRCQTRSVRGPSRCAGNSVSRVHLERCAAQLAMLLLIGPPASSDGPDLREQRIAELEGQIEAIVRDLYPDSGRPSAVVAKALHARLKEKEAELEEHQKIVPIRTGQRSAPPALVEEWRGRLRSLDVGKDGLAALQPVGLWETLPVEERRELIAGVLDRIVVTRGNRAATARLPNEQRGWIEDRLQVALVSDPTELVPYTDALQEAAIGAITQVRAEALVRRR